MDAPMKLYWMGEDIEQLPQERLIEIIRALGRQLDRHYETTRSIIEVSNMTRSARR